MHIYGGEELSILGSIMVIVEYQLQKERVRLLVVHVQCVAGSGPSLMGCDWLIKIRLDWQQLNHLQSTAPGSLQAVLDNHGAVFKDELGLVKGTSVKIHLKLGA